LVTSTPILETIGVQIPAPLRDCLEASGWSVSAESIDECSRHLSDEILDAFSIAGSPADCARKLTEVARLGVKEMAMVALPAVGQTPEQLAQRLAAEVLPAVRTALDTQVVPSCAGAWAISSSSVAAR